jgi:hypothetical protein
MYTHTLPTRHFYIVAPVRINMLAAFTLHSTQCPIVLMKWSCVERTMQHFYAVHLHTDKYEFRPVIPANICGKRHHILHKPIELKLKLKKLNFHIH